MFERIKGQKRALSLLQRAIEIHRLAGTYLFHGPDGTGKFLTALETAKALCCRSAPDHRPCGNCDSCKKIDNFNHPDLSVVFPTPRLDMTPEGEIKQTGHLKEYQEFLQHKIDTPWKEFVFSAGAEIRIDMIRMVQHRLHRTPSESRYKVCIVEKAEKMNVEAANAFLKTLEEPPPDTIIILTTHRPDMLMPTILSRCQKIPFHRLSIDTIAQHLEKSNFIPVREAMTFARIASGNMETALQLAAEGQTAARQISLDFLRCVLHQNDAAAMELAGQFRSKSLGISIQGFFSHLILWLGEIALYRDDPDQQMSPEENELFDLFYQANPTIDAEAYDAILELETLLRQAEGHIFIYLIIAQTYRVLGRILGFREYE